MSLIAIQNLTFAYEGSYDTIFKQVNLQLDSNWKLGFVGRNGRGKTTFLRLLLGDYAYQGTISAAVDFQYFPFAVPDQEKNTQQIMTEICGEAQVWQINREISLLDLTDDVLLRPFSTLSEGEKTKILLAALFLRQDSFLLIDEPTNHLDLKARQIVSDYLQRKAGFILVSHDRSFLDHCVDHILAINQANIEIQRGNFSSWWLNKNRQDQFEWDENEKQKKEIGRLQELAKATAVWSQQIENTKIGQGPVDRGYIGHQAAKMMKRSKNTEKRVQRSIEEKAKLLKNRETAEKLAIHPLRYHADTLLELRDVSVSYDQRIVCQNIRLAVHRGDRIALTGKNGCGKTSLLKLILGKDIPYQGVIYRGSQLKISYVPQDTSFLHGDLKAFAEQNGIDESLFKTILRKLDFSRLQFEKPMQTYSMGQKKKVVIAASLCEKAHLYLWDEPLNYIDLLSRMQIEEIILQDAPTIVFVEHDAAFVQRIATQIITLQR